MFITFVRWRLSVGIKRFTYLLTYLLKTRLSVYVESYRLLWIYLEHAATVEMLNVVLQLAKQCLSELTCSVLSVSR